MLENDISTALKVMILTLTFYKIGNNFQQKNEKIFLQASISNHPLWNLVDFWECAIFNSIKEELKCQKVYHLNLLESDNETSNREKNIIFGQLASYSHNMLMFGLKKDLVKEITILFIKNFYLTDIQCKDLMVN